MASTIKLKNGSGVPLAADLVQGEPALDLTNKRLYTEDSGGAVIEIGTNPSTLTTGAFTSTGIDDNATSTAITIDASENVGIGVTPSAWGTAYFKVIEGKGGSYLAFQQNAKGLSLGSNAYVDSSLVARYVTTDEASRYYQNAGVHTWSTAPSGTAGNAITFTQAMTLDAGGVLSVPAGYYVGGTAAANLLDDYEEGTWTPTVEGTTTAGTFTYNTRVGTYTKIGNVVRVNCEIYINSVSVAPVGTLKVTGAPFTAAGVGVVGNHGAAVLYHVGVVLTKDYSMIGKDASNTKFTGLDLGQDGTQNLADSAAVVASSYLRFFATYTV